MNEIQNEVSKVWNQALEFYFQYAIWFWLAAVIVSSIILIILWKTIPVWLKYIGFFFIGSFSSQLVLLAWSFINNWIK